MPEQNRELKNRVREIRSHGSVRGQGRNGLALLGKTMDRITFDPAVMGGKPCIRGLRVTVGTLVGLIAAGRTRDEILKLYPYLEAEDIAQALAYAAWRVEEIEVPLAFA